MSKSGPDLASGWAGDRPPPTLILSLMVRMAGRLLNVLFHCRLGSGLQNLHLLRDLFPARVGSAGGIGKILQAIGFFAELATDRFAIAGLDVLFVRVVAFASFIVEIVVGLPHRIDRCHFVSPACYRRRRSDRVDP